MIAATQSCNDYGFIDLTPQPAEPFDSDAALADNDKLAEFFADSMTGQESIALYLIGPFPSQANTEREHDACFERISAMTVPQLVAVLMQGTNDKWLAHAARALRERFIDKVTT